MAHAATSLLQERFADFKSQVDALTQQVKSLTHDKECLRSRNDLLETMMEEELKCVGGATRALTSGHATETPDPASTEEVPRSAGHFAFVCFAMPIRPLTLHRLKRYPAQQSIRHRHIQRHAQHAPLEILEYFSMLFASTSEVLPSV